MPSSSTQYAMEGEWNNSNVSNKKRPRHRRGNSHQVQEEEDDGEGSLTYSAASSSSSAGESTDSSFADIMKALEGDAELAAFCKKDPSMQKKLDKLRKQQQQSQQSTEASEASSLNYSTDGESALNGEHLLQTITGQPSASYGPDGGGLGTRQRTQETLDNLLFREADPSADTRVDSKFSKKVRTPKTKNTSKSKQERRIRDHREESRNRESQNESGTREYQDDERPRDLHKVEHSKLNPHPRSSTPPTVPRRSIPAVAADDEVWYAKWWMCGFTDAFRDLVPKR